MPIFQLVISYLRPEKFRKIQLDVLRGIAILLVLSAHHRLSEAGALQPLADVFWRFGWSGVDLFFVLSGFLVGGLLIKEIKTKSSLDVGRFIIRRGFKIWPGYFFFLFCYVLFFNIVSNWSIESLVPYLLQIQNYFITLGLAEHTWSLAVEEHFYLFLPFVLYLINKMHQKGGARMEITSIHLIPIIAIGLMVYCIRARYLTFTSLSDKGHYWLVWYPTHLRMDSLFFGVLIAYLHYYHNDFIKKIMQYRLLILFLGFAFVSPMMVIDWESSLFVFTFGFTMLYVGYGCILMAVVNTSANSVWYKKGIIRLLARTVAFIGYFSYSIYLWHFSFTSLITDYLYRLDAFHVLPKSIGWIISLVCYVIGAVIIGVVMGVIVERPALAIRDKIYPSRVSHALKE